jgi:hypothetical protein
MTPVALTVSTSVPNSTGTTVYDAAEELPLFRWLVQYATPASPAPSNSSRRMSFFMA